MATMPDPGKVVLQSIDHSWFHQQALHVSMLRLDLLDPVISGNKYFKLKYNLETAVRQGFQQIITFGGAYSNHLIATAAAANAKGLKSIGIVRGWHGTVQETETLRDCKTFGMEIVFIGKEEYNLKTDLLFLEKLRVKFGASFIIPEGGSNEEGRNGAEEIATFIPEDTTHVCLPIGTGTTFAGLRNALPASINMIGFTAMKGGEYLEPEIRNWLHAGKDANWQLATGFHFGGFAKCPPELMQFMQDFQEQLSIPLDRVYTSKMMFGMRQMLHQAYFPAGSRIICIHTGGLQGNRS